MQNHLTPWWAGRSEPAQPLPTRCAGQVDEVLAVYAQASALAHKGNKAAAAGVLTKLEDVRRRGRKRDMFG